MQPESQSLYPSDSQPLNMEICSVYCVSVRSATDIQTMIGLNQLYRPYAVTVVCCAVLKVCKYLSLNNVDNVCSGQRNIRVCQLGVYTFIILFYFWVKSIVILGIIGTKMCRRALKMKCSYHL